MLETELFDLLEGTSDAAFAVTDRGEICSWNIAAEKLLGYKRADALGNTCHGLLQGRGSLGTPLCGETCTVRECAAQHIDIPNFDLQVMTGSGNQMWINVSILVFENHRNRRHLIVHLAHDITDRKKKEELLRAMMDISRQMAGMQDLAVQPAPITPLSQHEREILRLFSMGKNSSEIARKLKITPQTLRNHLHHINQKLRTHTRLEAVTHALRRKLL